jgi:hypothetical protein
MLLILGLVAFAAPAAGQLDVDMTITNVVINPAGGGLANVTATVGLVGWGSLPAFNSGISLEVDGTELVVEPVVTLPYVAQGCTYYPDWNNLGPACIEEPGCDIFFVNGGSVPGFCFLGNAFGYSLLCGCWHEWQVLFPNVAIAGAAILRVIADVQDTIWELREDNNVFMIQSPVPVGRDTWGAIKAIYR